MMMPTLFAATLVVASVAAAQVPRFDVALVKRNVSGAGSSNAQIHPGGVTLVNVAIRDVLKNVLNLPDFAIVGGPEWLVTDRYDILARAEGTPPRAEVLRMLHRLIVERSHLVSHTERRTIPVYELVVARSDRRPGPRMTPTTTSCADTPPAGATPCGFELAGGSLVAVGMPIERFVRSVAQLSGRPVIDKTGLSGLWDLNLTWTPDAVAAALPTDSPALFTAIQDQLGLRLVSARSEVEVLVIDSAERPTAD
jgi:uncharacterized protein (TIGR03435 family)